MFCLPVFIDFAFCAMFKVQLEIPPKKIEELIYIFGSLTLFFEINEKSMAKHPMF